MWSKVLAVTLSSALGAACSFALPDLPKCKGNAKLVGDCFAIHGRMREGNGSPGIRIWRVGTDRLLGVNVPGEDDPDVAWLPDSIYRKLDYDHQVFADFVVCPLTKQTEDEMQIVCVESATRIVRAVIPPQKKEW
jgi:hypothetical protein